MGPIDFRLVLLAAVCIAALLNQRLLRELAARIQDAIDRFRGGPPTPMHPSPAADSALLRKRLKRAE